MTKSKARSGTAGAVTRAKSVSSSTEVRVDTLNVTQSGCKLCSKVYVEKSTKMLKCNISREYFCIGCIGMDVRTYEVLCRSDSMWFCPPCRVTVEKSILTDRKIEERCREIMETFEKRLEDLENSMKRKCEISDVECILKKEMEKVVKQMETPQCSHEIFSEEIDRQSRENNMVIFGVPEQPDDDGNKRLRADIRVVERIIETCGNAQGGPQKVIRLGKRPDSSTASSEKGRPMLVKFDSPRHKRNIFKNIQRLRSYEQFSFIQIRNDLTKLEREKESKLHKEAKRKEEQESEANIYRVRGPPWNRKIVHISRKQDI